MLEDGVGYGGGFDGGADFVDAKDVGSGEDGRYVDSGGGVGPDPRGGTWGSKVSGGVFGVYRTRIFYGLAEEALARGSYEDRVVELVELIQVGQEGEVGVADFAEAEAGVEDDFVARDASGQGRF